MLTAKLLMAKTLVSKRRHSTETLEGKIIASHEYISDEDPYRYGTWNHSKKYFDGTKPEHVPPVRPCSY